MNFARFSTASLVLGIVLCTPSFTHAQAIISEIMYDLSEGSDSGREWIEIYNAGNVAVSVTDLKVTENGKLHVIKALAGTSLQPDAYAIVADNPAKFQTDWPSFSGLIFDSAFSLNNTGESIGLANAADAPLDTVTYTNQQANGTGDSLQRYPVSGTTFSAGMPTPGADVPASGLVATAPKKTAQAKKNVAAAIAPVVVGTPDTSHEMAPIEITPQKQRVSLWWLAPMLLAVAASVMVVWARHLKKDEWEIEEMVETG